MSRRARRGRQAAPSPVDWEAQGAPMPSLHRRELHNPMDDRWVPALASYAPPEEENLYPLPWDEQEGEPQPVFETPRAIPVAGRPARHFAGVALALCLLVWLGLGLFVWRARTPLAGFEAKAQEVLSDRFADGIVLDGLQIGGLTRQEAEQRLRDRAAQSDTSLRLQVTAGERSYTITGQQIPFVSNQSRQLDRAWALGRQGFSWMIGSGRSPFDIRYEHRRHTGEQGAYLQSQSTYRPEDLRMTADWLAGQLNRKPINAVIESFDFSTKAFTVTRDVPGAAISAQVIYDKLAAAIESGSRQGSLHLQPEIVLPQVTSVELLNNFVQLGSFSTRTTNDQKRNINIALASRAITGSTVMPGESFSFNKATGERTAAKGYQMAPAIAGGITFDEIGGGVCQVSSTLFNAAAMAGMHIEKRAPHAWPSNYVDKGLDATVNWPNLDFIFRNEQDTPVFIVADFQGRDLRVEVYGMRSGPGESIRLQTELISTRPPPEQPALKQNTALAPGTQRELKSARTGYVVDTYRVYLRDGQEYRREKLFTSDYRMVQQLIEYN